MAIKITPEIGGPLTKENEILIVMYRLARSKKVAYVQWEMKRRNREMNEEKNYLCMIKLFPQQGDLKKSPARKYWR